MCQRGVFGASLIVCQSQASSAATSKTVRPPPTWTVADLAALVVNRQFLAAMRWSSNTQVFVAQVRCTQRMRCFFQASDIGCPVDGKVHVVHRRAFFDLGRSMAPRATDLARYLLDNQLDVGTPAHIGHDVHVFEAHQGGEDLSRVENEGTSCFLAHTSSLKCFRPILGDVERTAPRQNPKNRRCGLART